MADPLTGDWHWELIHRLGLPRRVFPEVVEPGTVIGPITVGPAAWVPRARRRLARHGLRVVGAPLAGPDDAYLSSGTWLLGMELTGPVLTPASAAANLTNEAGVDGTVRYLKNVMGMWILSEAVRDWQAAGAEVSVPELAVAARAVEDAPRFDATDDSLSPGNMPARVKALVGDDPRMDDPVFLDPLGDRVACRCLRRRRRPARRAHRPRAHPRRDRRRRLPQLTALPAHRRPHRPARQRRPRRGDGDRQLAHPGPRRRAVPELST